MKAVEINHYGGPEVLEVNEIETPEIAADQVLVEVHAASINPVDDKLISGALKGWMPVTFPAVLGSDIAGKIVEIGSDVTNFKVDDLVYGFASARRGGTGAYEEFAAASPGHLGIQPKDISDVEAAALPMVGISAMQALEDHMHLKKGQKILIHGGAGGIGSMAIQMAKAMGAYVATTVRAEHREFVKSLGADEVIDYQKEFFEEKLKDYDAVLDTVGGETKDKSFKVLKKGGILVSMLGEPDKELAKKHEVKIVGEGTMGDTDHLNRLSKLVESGKVKPIIDKVFSFKQAREAFKYFEEAHPKGKVILKF